MEPTNLTEQPRRGRVPNSSKGQEVATQRLMLILTPSEQESIRELSLVYQRVLTSPRLEHFSPELADMLETRHGGNPRSASSQNQMLKEAVRQFTASINKIASEMAAESPG